MAIDIKVPRLPRTSVNWPAFVLTHRGTIEGTVTNIGLDGAFIESATPIEDDKPVTMIVRPPFNEHPLLIMAEKVWSNISPGAGDNNHCGVGVQFEELRKLERQFIAEIVFGHLKEIPEE